MISSVLKIRRRLTNKVFKTHSAQEAISESESNNLEFIADAAESQSLLGIMPTDSACILQGLLQKVNFNGDWSPRQGSPCICVLIRLLKLSY